MGNTATGEDGEGELGTGYWVTALLVWTIGALIMTVMVIYHYYATYLDLLTVERKSVSHRRRPPKKTSFYVTIMVLTACCIFFYLLAMVCGVWGNFTESKLECFYDDLVFSISFQCAKTSMYCIFLMRLHGVFHETVYGYKYQYLLLYALSITAVSVVIIIGAIAGTEANVVHYQFDDFMVFCNGTVPDWVIVLVGMLNIAVSIGFLVGFILPLNKVIKDYVDKNSLISPLSDRTTSKILFNVMKYKILISTATITTVLSLFIGGFSGIVFFAMIDFIVTSCCVLLMTDYYPDITYYTRLCFCCIKCCDKNQYSKWSPRALDVDIVVGTTESKSFDTNDANDALRLIAKAENGNHVTKVEDVEVAGAAAKGDNNQ